MADDLDILHTAKLLVQQHGDQEATLHASMRADELLGKGDLEETAAWRRVIEAIDLLSAGLPLGEDEKVH